MALSPPARADDVFALQATRTGHIDYVFTGAAMTDDTGVANGAACLLTSNTAPVTAAMLSQRPTLLQATLYVSGSLLQDGLDYPPNTYIFEPPAGADPATVTEVARQSASISVQFQPPGAAAPQTVSVGEAQTYVSTYAVGGNNFGFFTTPIDVTQLILAQGGNLVGDYRVSGLVADVCDGLEAVCGTTTCSQISKVHPNGNASFALLLIYEDLALPLHSVSTFNGMYELADQSKSISLVNGNSVSDPASGSIAVYVIEGDLSIGDPNVAEVCGGDEYIQVSSTPGNGGPVCLNDADNPVGNIFNDTINILPADNTPPCANPNAWMCCEGPHLCGLAGVDIDRYDISGALTPGATEIDIQVATGNDRIALAALVLGVDVFQPVLQEDTQFRSLGPLPGAAQVGAPLVMSLAISNTGNVPATGVTVDIDAPAGTYGLELVLAPGDGNTTLDPTGGQNGTGSIHATGINVDAGKIAEIRFQLTTACALAEATLTFAAAVSGSTIQPFDVQAAPLLVGGPGAGSCTGQDLRGPFATIDPLRVLRGGGCAATPTSSLAPALMVMFARWLRRARSHKRRPRDRASLGRATYVALACAFAGCGRHHQAPAPPPSQALTNTTDLPGTACSQPLMVQVQNLDGSTFCIDRFEASTNGASLGLAQQSNDDTSLQPDGTTLAAARVALAAMPTANVSWYQAKSACLNAGKRLCTTAEWERACRGNALLLYPYADTVDDSACNGFFQYRSSNPAPTGSYRRCVSPSGAYDLSGNLEEWLDTPVERFPGTATLDDRALHGGSYDSNDDALACVGVESHAAPSTAAPDRGFRCCL